MTHHYSSHLYRPLVAYTRDDPRTDSRANESHTNNPHADHSRADKPHTVSKTHTGQTGIHHSASSSTASSSTALPSASLGTSDSREHDHSPLSQLESTPPNQTPSNEHTQRKQSSHSSLHEAKVSSKQPPQIGNTHPHQGWRINRYIPHVVTLLSTSIGFLAIYNAIEALWGVAIMCIVVAAILDTVDGKIARALHTSNRFGVELDSLSDVVVFGCIPPVVVYMWGLNYLDQIGWIAATYFMVCAVLRLARFNTLEIQKFYHDQPLSKKYDERFFSGIPTPAAAVCMLTPIAVSLRMDITPYVLFSSDVYSGAPSELLLIFLMIWCMTIGTLMIMPIPTFAFKGWKVPAPYHVMVFALIALFLAAMVSFPWITGIITVTSYLTSIPFAWILKNHYQKTSKEQ